MGKNTHKPPSFKEMFLDDYAYRAGKENPEITKQQVDSAAQTAKIETKELTQGIGGLYDPQTKTITMPNDKFTPATAHELGGHHMRKELFGGLANTSENNKQRLNEAYPRLTVPLEEIIQGRNTEEKLATNTQIRAAIMQDTGLSKEELDNYIQNLSDAELLAMLHKYGNGYIFGSKVPFLRNSNSNASVDDWIDLQGKLPEGETSESWYGISDEERAKTIEQYKKLFEDSLTDEDRKQADALRYTLLNIAKGDHTSGGRQNTLDWLDKFTRRV